ncbi:MAG: 16S rRNA (guanine(966)-N(2))-methyltransferase RsmD, partial [Gammaproteobacteria bacterium]|nr:16S rRNA (guanine(966)-N(2))-methyltransferase RsmD [Gammaproteobacteria bacterium]
MSKQSRKYKQTNNRSTQHPDQGELRIIGGKWRSRKLTFPAIQGLRPTP